MKIGLVGPSYQMRSLPFDAQRTVNLIPIVDRDGAEVASLLGTPGLDEFTSLQTGSGRKCFASANGRAFVCSGGNFSEVDENGIEMVRGTLNQPTGNLSICENGPQLAICDGETLFIFTYATNTFAEVTDPDFPASVGYVTAIDGYFVVNENGTGKFYISALLDGTSWDALDFATAESDPDSLLCPRNSNGQLFLFGYRTFEIWTNSGASSFPFTRVAGAVGQIGILAIHTAVDVDNSLIWVGRDQTGQAIVYRANGFRPQRISTEAIEILLQSADDAENMKAFCYQQDGHTFYFLTGGGLATSLVFDLSTQLWHERAYLGENGQFQQHLAADCMFAFSKHLVCDRLGAKVYEMRLDLYSDDGNEIPRDRIYTHINNEQKPTRYNRLEIGVESGVGLQSGNGSNPLASLRLSKDGGRTWTDWTTAEIGAVGEYKNKVVFRRLGIAEQMTFHLRISDPVKVAITGSYLS